MNNQGAQETERRSLLPSRSWQVCSALQLTSEKFTYRSTGELDYGNIALAIGSSCTVLCGLKPKVGSRTNDIRPGCH